MTAEALHKLGEEFRDLVVARTGLKGNQLVCPREKSDMTPCVARDGGICVIEIPRELAVCVGCETSIVRQIALEKEKLVAGPDGL